MLGVKLLNSCRAATTGQFIHRRIPLPEGDDAIPIVQCGKDFTKAPDAAFIQSFVRCAPLLPETFEPRRVQPTRAPTCFPIGINDFQQIAALGASDALGPVFAHGSAPDAAQLRYGWFQF